MSLALICHVFVYGTLKRGQLREGMWPHQPLRVTVAETRGRLYDLGPYPALVTGEDRVGGEIWEFSPQHMSRTLSVLDEIEGYAGGPDDLYERVVLHCTTEGAETLAAFSYLYARSNLLTATRLRPDHDGVCRWPAA